MLASLILFSLACEKDKLRALATANDRVAATISIAIDLKRELGQQHLISPSDELALTNALLDVNRAFVILNGHARAYTKLGPEEKVETVALLNDVSRAVQELNSQGVLHIRDEQAKARFSAAVQGVDIAVQAVILLIQGVK